MDIRSCTGCVTCGYEGPCILHDDDQKIRKAVLHADMIVFATLLYYYGMSAQLKPVVDRFCAYNSNITRKLKPAVENHMIYAPRAGAEL